MALNLHHLRIFARVAELGGFSRAAEALHLSQPAVSKSVRELERQLQTTLFDRSAGAHRLTDAGAALLTRARELFAVERTGGGRAAADARARGGRAPHRGKHDDRDLSAAELSRALPRRASGRRAPPHDREHARRRARPRRAARGGRARGGARRRSALIGGRVARATSSCSSRRRRTRSRASGE